MQLTEKKMKNNIVNSKSKKNDFQTLNLAAMQTFLLKTIEKN